MLGSVAVRAQISSIIDALSKAAVAEILKVFEDGMVVLRLEVCQRDSEIKKLKTNLEVLHSELRSVQERVSLQAGSRGRDGEIRSSLLPRLGSGHRWTNGVRLSSDLRSFGGFTKFKSPHTAHTICAHRRLCVPPEAPVKC